MASSHDQVRAALELHYAWLAEREVARLARREAVHQQEAVWAAIERQITQAFTRSPYPDVSVLRFWWDRQDQLRPDFRPTFLEMCQHPTVRPLWQDLVPYV